MSEKKINTRITNKHDTEVNWNKANNFIPKSGELIIYDADDNYDYPRVKIGDGETIVSLLPFFVSGSDEVYIGTEEPTDENVKIWINPEDTADSYITEEELNKKVDKVEGKGLSTNDYTTAEKNKLGALPSVTEDNYDIINADDYVINAKILNVAKSSNNGVTINPNGITVESNSAITLATNDFSQIVTSEGDNLQRVVGSLPTHDPENNTLDARKYNTIYSKGFNVELNGVEGVSMSPNGFYTNSNDFSTIYNKQTDLQTVLDEIRDLTGNDGFSPRISVSETTNGHTITITDVDGTKTVNIKDGEDGEDGTSVTIKSLGQSSTDDGNNVIIFSDGNSLTIKNGSKGSKGDTGVGIKSVAQTTTSSSDGGNNVITVTKTDNTTSTFTVKNGSKGSQGDKGDTPVKGVDYWTEEDKEEINAESIEYISTELAKRGQLKPEFANSVDECTDTSKLYVLPDGYIYAYMLKTSSGPSYTNMIPLAVNTDGTPFVGLNGEKGYKTGYRMNSSNAEVASADNCVTGYIPVKSGDVIRVKNTSKKTGNGYYHWYNTSFAIYRSYYYEQTNNGVYNTKPDSNGLITFTAPSDGTTTLAYFRFTTGVIDDTSIITLNEEITEGNTTTTSYVWASTGHAFVPADYENRIVKLENTTQSHAIDISSLEDRVTKVETGITNLTDVEKLAKIKNWDKPVYDYSPITLLSTERNKPALTSSDRTVDAVYAKYRALMAKHPRYITETNLGPSTSSSTFSAVDILRFDFKEPDGLVEGAKYTINETKPKIIFMSGVHNEYAGIYGLYYALEEIAENPDFEDIRRNAHIIVVPCSNPFGLTSQTAIDGWVMSHVNANGVAIHNNFGVEYNTYNADATVGAFNYGGTTAYSELETQYIDNLMAENSDAIAFVSCHNYNKDVVFGSLAIWASSATAHMCNLAYRLIDKISKAWHRTYGTALQEAIETYRLDTLPEGETRLGWAQFSTSAGTEQLNATKYGIQATNLEISDNMRVFQDKQFSTDVMTRGAEVYANYIRIILTAYNSTDKEAYYK